MTAPWNLPASITPPGFDTYARRVPTEVDARPTTFLRAGTYHVPPQTAATASFGNGNARAVPIWLPRAVTLDRIGLEVTTAGATGALYRLGIFDDDGNGLPSTVRLDAGTVDAATTGAKELTISHLLGPGLFWLAGAQQGAPATNATVRVTNSAMLFCTAVDNITSTQHTAGCYQMGGQTGAFTAWTTTVTLGINGPRIFFRVAA